MPSTSSKPTEPATDLVPGSAEWNKRIRTNLALRPSTKFAYDEGKGTIEFRDKGWLKIGGREIRLADPNAELTATFGNGSATETEKLRELATMAAVLAPMDIHADPAIAEQGVEISYTFPNALYNTGAQIIHYDDVLGYWFTEPAELKNDGKTITTTVDNLSPFTLAFIPNFISGGDLSTREALESSLESSLHGVASVVESSWNTHTPANLTKRLINSAVNSDYVQNFGDNFVTGALAVFPESFFEGATFITDKVVSLFDIDAPDCRDLTNYRGWGDRVQDISDRSVKHCVGENKDGDLVVRATVANVVPYGVELDRSYHGVPNYWKELLDKNPRTAGEFVTAFITTVLDLVLAGAWHIYSKNGDEWDIRPTGVIAIPPGEQREVEATGTRNSQLVSYDYTTANRWMGYTYIVLSPALEVLKAALGKEGKPRPNLETKEFTLINTIGYDDLLEIGQCVADVPAAIEKLAESRSVWQDMDWVLNQNDCLTQFAELSSDLLENATEKDHNLEKAFIRTGNSVVKTGTSLLKSVGVAVDINKVVARGIRYSHQPLSYEGTFEQGIGDRRAY